MGAVDPSGEPLPMGVHVFGYRPIWNITGSEMWVAAGVNEQQSTLHAAPQLKQLRQQSLNLSDRRRHRRKRRQGLVIIEGCLMNKSSHFTRRYPR